MERIKNDGNFSRVVKSQYLVIPRTGHFLQRDKNIFTKKNLISEEI